MGCAQIFENFYELQIIILGSPMQVPSLELPTITLPVPEFNHEDIKLEDTIEKHSAQEKKSQHIDQNELISNNDTIEVPRLKFEYLSQITNGFDRMRSVGEGGFSEVFQGETSNRTYKVGIKKLNNKQNPINRKQIREVVNFEGNNALSFFK